MPDFAGGSEKGGVPGARHLEKQVTESYGISESQSCFNAIHTGNPPGAYRGPG